MTSTNATTARTFRKRPIEVQAVQWTGDNAAEVAAFAGHDFEALGEPCDDDPDATAAVRDDRHGGAWALLYAGDWVVRLGAGRFIRCPAYEFAATYEPVSA